MFDGALEQWAEKRLTDIASINPKSLGQRTDRAFSFGYIDISQIERPGECAGWSMTTFEQAPSRARRVVRAGDILVSTVRPYLRAFARVPPSNCPLVASTGFAVVRALDGVDQGFLFQHVMSEGFVEHLKPRMTGSNYPAVSAVDVGDYTLNLPPVEEQRRIAEVLQSIDDAISANRDALKQVERSRSAILHAAFEETDWEPVLLGELGRWQSGSTPSKGVAANWGGGVPWICPRDMKVPVISKTSDTISRVALRGSCRLAPIGTLMLVVRGMILARALPTAITAVEAAYNQDMKAFVPNGRASARFVQLCIQHQEAHLLQMVNTATHGTKKLDTETIESIPIPLPDANTQNDLVATVSRLDEATVYYGTEHLRLSELRRGLRRELLSGRVRVPA